MILRRRALLSHPVGTGFCFALWFSGLFLRLKPGCMCVKIPSTQLAHELLSWWCYLAPPCSGPVGTSALGPFSACNPHDHTIPLRWQYEQRVPEPKTGYKGPPIRKSVDRKAQEGSPEGNARDSPQSTKLREQMGLVSPFGMESVVCLGTTQEVQRGSQGRGHTQLPSSPCASLSRCLPTSGDSKQNVFSFPSDLGFNTETAQIRNMSSPEAYNY